MNIWISTTAQLLTLTSVGLVLIVMPFLHRKRLQHVSSDVRTRYLRICDDVFVQVSLSVLLPLLLSMAVVGFGSLVLSEGITTTFLGIFVSSGASALWNVRKAYVALELAEKTSENSNRNAKINNVKEKNLKVFGVALISLVLGVLGLLIASISFSILPAWSWFACFLLSGFSFFSVSWSVAVLIAADEYERNLKLGKHSKKHASS